MYIILYQKIKRLCSRGRGFKLTAKMPELKILILLNY